MAPLASKSFAVFSLDAREYTAEVKIGILGHLHFPIREPFAGGLEAHTARTAQAFAERGHEVILTAKAGSRLDDERVQIVDVLNADFTWRPADKLSPEEAEAQADALDKATARGCRAVRDAGCDAVLNNSLHPAPYLHLRDMPMLTLLHTPATLERVNQVLKHPSWKPEPWHRWASVSASNATDWARMLPRVDVIPNGVDVNAWPARLERHDASSRRAVWTGRITPEKGTHIAIEAAKIAGWELDVYGPISDEQYFASSIEPELTDAVRYGGHLTHRALAQAVAAADVLVASPLWPEPFGFVAAEALACGTPVAALPNGAMPEVVGDAGAIATAVSPEALAEAITRAANVDRRQARARAELFVEDAAMDAYLAALGECREIRERLGRA